MIQENIDFDGKMVDINKIIKYLNKYISDINYKKQEDIQITTGSKKYKWIEKIFRYNNDNDKW